MTECGETHFGRNKGSERTIRTNLEFGSEQSSDGPGSGLEEVCGSTVGRCCRNVSTEIVGHFGFECDVGMNVETYPSANANEVSVLVGRAKAEVVREGSNLEVVIGEPGALGHHHGRHSQAKNYYSDER